MASVFVCACIGNPQNASAVVTPAVTQTILSSRNPVDVTNQNSPLAATFRNGASYTPLVTPQPLIRLEKVAGGFSSPMMIAVPPDNSGRLFVTDQIGVVKIITPDKNVADTPFLDVRDRMVRLSTVYDERGLFSLAFHPDYKNNGRVFVYYSAPLQPGAPAGWSCTNRLSEFRVMPQNPDRVDMNSEKILLSVDKPQSNHNGGPILFGPDDGYLYLALGDGGGADDTAVGHTPATGNAQDITKLLGKIIRIDVDTPPEVGKMYAIPPDNPFIATPEAELPEIYAIRVPEPCVLCPLTAGGTIP